MGESREDGNSSPSSRLNFRTASNAVFLIFITAAKVLFFGWLTNLTKFKL